MADAMQGSYLGQVYSIRLGFFRVYFFITWMRCSFMLELYIEMHCMSNFSPQPVIDYLIEGPNINKTCANMLVTHLCLMHVSKYDGPDMTFLYI